MAARDNRVSGRDILAEVHRLYEPYRAAMAARGRTVCIIRVEAADGDPPPWRARMQASQTSAEQKVKNFTTIGMQPPQHIVLPPDVSPGAFVALIEQANADPAVAAIIVQQPVPARLRQFVEDIAASKDIDALTQRSPYRACATAEGIWRVTQPFTGDRPGIAVVGAQGFVGRGVVDLLRDNGHDPLTLEQGDDLGRVVDADIVVSVTGVPRLLGAEHLRQHHRLVVDSGFYPLPDNGVHGDVRAEAAGIPQNITPVPGGIGPVEMAVLVDRAVRAELQVDTTAWTYQGRAYKPRLSRPADAAKLAAIGFPQPARPTHRPRTPPAGQPQPRPRPPDRGVER